MSKYIDGKNHWERSRPSTNPCSNCEWRSKHMGEKVCLIQINFGGNPIPLPKNLKDFPSECPEVRKADKEKKD